MPIKCFFYEQGSKVLLIETFCHILVDGFSYISIAKVYMACRYTWHGSCDTRESEVYGS